MVMLETLGNGWVPANETWTYASADSPTFVITVPTGATGKYSVGMRVKLTQTTAKYFIITAVSDTTLTVYGGTDYTLANAAITSPNYSPMKAPRGFPLSPAKWRVVGTQTADSTRSTTTNWQSTDLSMSIPLGAWDVWYKISVSGIGALATSILWTSISTLTNSEVAEFTDYSGNNSTQNLHNGNGNGLLSLASKTTYYVTCRYMNSGATASVTAKSGDSHGYFVATCAYL